ncbi:hypothetical protein HO906_07515 [Streptococcus suis]|nr:hypothetical protein [Streptococcus suis]
MSATSIAGGFLVFLYEKNWLEAITKTDIHIDASQNNLGIDLPNYINPKATNYLDISTLDGELNIR